MNITIEQITKAHGVHLKYPNKKRWPDRCGWYARLLTPDVPSTTTLTGFQGSAQMDHRSESWLDFLICCAMVDFANLYIRVPGAKLNFTREQLLQLPEAIWRPALEQMFHCVKTKESFVDAMEFYGAKKRKIDVSTYEHDLLLISRTEELSIRRWAWLCQTTEQYVASAGTIEILEGETWTPASPEILRAPAGRLTDVRNHLRFIPPNRQPRTAPALPKIQAILDCISSTPDTSGNIYWAFRYTCTLTGHQVVGIIIGGESNLSCAKGQAGLCPSENVYYTYHELKRNKFNALISDWPYAGCPPIEIAKFIKQGLDRLVSQSNAQT